MNKAPCKNCERRTVKPNCHATCQDYADFVNDREKYRADKRKNAIIAEYIKTQSKRTGRR